MLSPRIFNIATGLMIACPVTNQVKGSPWEVPLPRDGKATGVVLSDQIRSLDWLARNAELYARVTEDVVAGVLGRVEAILRLDPG